MEKHGFVCLMVLAVLFSGLSAYSGVFPEYGGRESQNDRARQAVLQILAIPSLSLSPESSERNRMEGVYGFMSDIPGGYCYRPSCDIAGAPFPLRSSHDKMQSARI